jgi:rhodanese-related sulfurtransferase
MKLLTHAVTQAIGITAVAFIVGFAHNSFNRNGVNPMRRRPEVPVVKQSIVDSMHAEAIRIIDLTEARLFVESGGRIIDARTKEAYEEGHIPGAILFDYYQLGTYCDRVLPLLSREEIIMIYCSELTCEDSELLAKELYSFGYRNLLLFKGGFAEWQAARLPVERGE